jgi:MFS family permease
MEVDEGDSLLMTAGSEPPTQQSFEWWYVAHLIFGIVYMGFVPILVPLYVLQETNSAAEAGVVMAIIGLGALAAPAIGGFADKYLAHRIAQLGGLIALALGGFLFALVKDDLMFAIAAILIGLGVATLMMINPTFIIGAGLEQDLESKRLTRLNQTAIVGQLIGGLLVARLTQLGLSFQMRFLVMAVVPVIGFVVVAATNKKAAERLKIQIQAKTEVIEGSQKVSLGTILFSMFGLFLVAMMVNGLGQAALESQYPNYMQSVFKIDPAFSAAALSVAAIANLILLIFAGRWMARSGPNPLFLASLVLRLAAAVVLIALAMLGESSPLLPLGMYVLLLIGIAWVDLVGPALTGRLSVGSMGASQGFLMGCLALGSALGSLLGGWTAESIGFQLLPWVTVLGVAAALVLGIVVVRRTSSAVKTQPG